MRVCLRARPGVGPKTAAVVRAQAFGVPSFPVDTHIHRCALRWGLTDRPDEKDPNKVSHSGRFRERFSHSPYHTLSYSLGYSLGYSVSQSVSQ